MKGESKHILSDAGWTSEYFPEDRRKTLEKALKKESLNSVIWELEWVERVWARLNFDAKIASNCRDDIQWLQDNFIQDGLNVKRIRNGNRNDVLYTITRELRKSPIRPGIACRQCGFKSFTSAVVCPKCKGQRFCDKCNNLYFNCICKE